MTMEEQKGLNPGNEMNYQALAESSSSANLELDTTATAANDVPKKDKGQGSLVKSIFDKLNNIGWNTIGRCEADVEELLNPDSGIAEKLYRGPRLAVTTATFAGFIGALVKSPAILSVPVDWMMGGGASWLGAFITMSSLSTLTLTTLANQVSGKSLDLIFKVACKAPHYELNFTNAEKQKIAGKPNCTLSLPTIGAIIIYLHDEYKRISTTQHKHKRANREIELFKIADDLRQGEVEHLLNYTETRKMRALKKKGKIIS